MKTRKVHIPFIGDSQAEIKLQLSRAPLLVPGATRYAYTPREHIMDKELDIDIWTFPAITAYFET